MPNWLKWGVIIIVAAGVIYGITQGTYKPLTEPIYWVKVIGVLIVFSIIGFGGKKKPTNISN